MGNYLKLNYTTTALIYQVGHPKAVATHVALFILLKLLTNGTFIVIILPIVVKGEAVYDNKDQSFRLSR